MKNQLLAVSTVILLLAMPTLQAAEDAKPLPPETVLAANKRVTVTYEDLQAELARIPAKDQYEFLMSKQRLATVVENILINKTLAAEARASGLDKKPNVQAEMRNQIDKVLAKYRGQEVQAKAPAANYEAKARELFIATPDRFVLPGRINTWHVLVSMQGRTREQAIARAEEVRQKLLAGAAPAEVALKYSDDPTKLENKGELGPLVRSELDPRFLTAAEKLKVGEFSAPVESAYGFHIIRLLGTLPERRPTYAEVKKELMIEAENLHVQAAWEEHIGAIRSDASTTVNAAALDSLRPKRPEIPVIPAAKPATK